MAGIATRWCELKAYACYIFVNNCMMWWQGPLARYEKLRCACTGPGMFSPPPLVSDPDMHHGTCVTHVPWCMPWSLICGFLFSRWRGKRSLHSQRMRNTQFCVSGKRPIMCVCHRGLYIFCCALLCHGCLIINIGFMWFIYQYSLGLLHKYWDNLMGTTFGHKIAQVPVK